MKRFFVTVLLLGGLAGCAGDDDTFPRARANLATTPAVTPTGSPAPTSSPDPSATSAPGPSSTPPAPPFRFLAIGDFGTGTPKQHAVADRMCAVRERRPFELVVTTGDNVYDEGHPDRFDETFFDPYRCLFNAGVRFRATLGNHDIKTDGGRPELEEPAFGFNGRNYVFSRGGVRFVMVDSNDVDFDWLRSALVPEATDRWTVVSFHHPVYATGEYGPTPGLTPRLPRMFRRKGVDLVLNGHEHQYSVTRNLRGIRYVVTGGGGASVRDCGAPAWFTATCIERSHFLEIVAGPDRLEVKAVPVRGPAIHRFSTSGRD